MHNFLINIFEKSPIGLSDKIASRLASLSWLVFVAFILIVALFMGDSVLEYLGVSYGIAGIVSFFGSLFISPLFGIDDPSVIGVVLLYATMAVMAITLLGLVVLIIIGLAKKKLFVWWILDVVVLIQVFKYSLGALTNTSLNNLSLLVLYLIMLYLLYGVRRYFR